MRPPHIDIERKCVSAELLSLSELCMNHVSVLCGKAAILTHVDWGNARTTARVSTYYISLTMARMRDGGSRSPPEPDGLLTLEGPSLSYTVPLENLSQTRPRDAASVPGERVTRFIFACFLSGKSECQRRTDPAPAAAPSR